MGNKSDKCSSCKYQIAPGGRAACDGCIHDEGLKDRYEPMTNADRIRNMTDEELAEVLADFVVRQGCSPVLQKLWRNSGAETLWRKHDDKENS